MTDLTSTVNLVKISSEDDENYICRKLSSVVPVYSTETTLSLMSEPIGTKLNSFSSGNDTFDMYLATHKDVGACELLSRAEKIAMWFIETADAVDFVDERWEVLWIYTTVVDDADSGVKSNVLAGYMTLFTFHNPFAGKLVVYL